MLDPSPGAVNADAAGRPVGGWLLLLCFLLIVGQPLVLALGASVAIEALPVRGTPLALVIVARILVAAVGVGAGLALFGRREGAATFAMWSLALSAATDLFVYATPYYPNNRMPGQTPIFAAVTVVYYVAWVVYLRRSTRVSRTSRSRPGP